MQSAPDADGTLLDHSLLSWGNGMSDGDAHDRSSNLPALLVGDVCVRDDGPDGSPDPLPDLEPVPGRGLKPGTGSSREAA